MKDLSDHCIGYDQKTKDCRFAKGRGWLYNRGQPGTICPFEGSLKSCNNYTHPSFKGEDEVIAYLKYGIEPGQNIPLDEFNLEKLTSTGILLNGTTITRPGQQTTVIKEDGKEHPLDE